MDKKKNFPVVSAGATGATAYSTAGRRARDDDAAAMLPNTPGGSRQQTARMRAYLYSRRGAPLEPAREAGDVRLARFLPQSLDAPRQTRSSVELPLRPPPGSFYRTELTPGVGTYQVSKAYATLESAASVSLRAARDNGHGSSRTHSNWMAKRVYATRHVPGPGAHELPDTIDPHRTLNVRALPGGPGVLGTARRF